MTPYRFGQKIAAGRSFWGDYTHQLNKFYNPWSDAWNEPAKDNLEKGLQYAGRTAMGVGAAAGLAAGGIAAAPAVTSAVTGAANTANAAIASAGTAAATQGQRIMDAAGRSAPGVMNFANRTMNTLNKINYSPADVAQDVVAAGTGNFDQIKGPAGPFKGPTMPVGVPAIDVPSFPRPLEVTKNLMQFGNDVSRYVANAGGNRLPHSPTN